jgi:broad specificity phosphatase PhoE
MTTTATRVFMVRHGATVLSAEDRFAGATDMELSEEGREQTRRLAESGKNYCRLRITAWSDG